MIVHIMGDLHARQGVSECVTAVSGQARVMSDINFSLRVQAGSAVLRFWCLPKP